MRFAIWSPTNPRDGVTHVDLYRQQVREIEIVAFLALRAPRLAQRPDALAKSVDRRRGVDY
jgi:hypothetical protein